MYLRTYIVTICTRVVIHTVRRQRAEQNNWYVNCSARPLSTTRRLLKFIDTTMARGFVTRALLPFLWQ